VLLFLKIEIMKFITLFFVGLSSLAYSQITYEKASELSKQYEVYAYSYFEGFAGKPGYAASVILTNDGGCAFLGTWIENDHYGPLLIKLDADGKEQWKLKVNCEYNESEQQGIVQDSNGNFYIFQLVYSATGYRGGCEQVVCVSATGEKLWDKLIGDFTLVNRPTFSYIHVIENGKVELRGHIVLDEPAPDKDPQYYFWSAFLNAEGKVEAETGKPIDWANDNWKAWYQAE